MNKLILIISILCISCSTNKQDEIQFKSTYITVFEPNSESNHLCELYDIYNNGNIIRTIRNMDLGDGTCVKMVFDREFINNSLNSVVCTLYNPYTNETTITRSFKEKNKWFQYDSIKNTLIEIENIDVLTNENLIFNHVLKAASSYHITRSDKYNNWIEILAEKDNEYVIIRRTIEYNIK